MKGCLQWIRGGWKALRSLGARAFDGTLLVVACSFPLVLFLGVPLPLWCLDLSLACLLLASSALFFLSRDERSWMYHRHYPKLIWFLSLAHFWLLALSLTHLFRRGGEGGLLAFLSSWGALFPVKGGAQLFVLLLVLAIVRAAWIRSRLTQLASAWSHQERLALFLRVNGRREKSAQSGPHEEIKKPMGSYFRGAAAAAKSLASGTYLLTGMALSVGVLLGGKFGVEVGASLGSLVALVNWVALSTALLLGALYAPASQLDRDLSSPS